MVADARQSPGWSDFSDRKELIVAENKYVSSQLVDRMRALGIDVELATEILDDYNRGRFDDLEPVQVSEIPGIDGDTVVDSREERSIRLDAAVAKERLSSIDPGAAALVDGTGEITVGNDTLRRIGLHLLPYVSYGVLNGGSATSYADEKKNRSVSEELFELLKGDFERLAPDVSGEPKGVTPAFVQPDGTPGPSFLELKMRHLLLAIKRYQQ